MCLSLMEWSDKKLQELCTAEGDSVTVFKALEVWDDDLLSPHMEMPWKKGMNCSSREGIELEPYERRRKEVDEGFHFYASSKVARSRPSSLTEIFRVRILKEDIVGIGMFDQAKSLVATKAELLGRENWFTCLCRKIKCFITREQREAA